MKLKIPKSVIISGKKWKVVTTDKEGGGWFDGRVAKISIGTKYAQDIEDIYIHEILEAILVERKHRYQLSRIQCDNGDLFFAFNHKDFEDICADLAYALFNHAPERNEHRKKLTNKVLLNGGVPEWVPHTNSDRRKRKNCSNHKNNPPADYEATYPQTYETCRKNP